MRLFLSLSLALASASAAMAAATPPSLAISDIPDAVKAELLQTDRDWVEYPLTNATEGLERRAPPNGLRGVRTRCNTPNCFALTFDDGPSTNMEFVANAVNAAGYKATFFINGFNHGCIYDEPNVQRLRKVFNQGHDICAHTWSHPNLAQLNAGQVKRQIDLMEEAMSKILGVIPRCIRAPYGSTNGAVIDQLNRRGYVIHGWTNDSRDLAGASAQSQLQQFRNASPSQQINMLLHDTARTTRQVVPEAVKILRQKDFNNVRGVGSTYGYNIYSRRGSFGRRDGSWTCNGKPRPGQA